ncbi:MAG: carbohydrate ABC transporter substrate-binding protein, partial [Anaerotignum sp.]|nr:carbohydrate ABC transporter substrate-binding protein [Anaerotignum sp.]
AMPSDAPGMGFVIPFQQAKESDNVFAKLDAEMTKAGKEPVSWNFTIMPSDEWKNGVGSALTAYAADQTDENWKAVVSAFVDGWEREYRLANG